MIKDSWGQLSQYFYLSVIFSGKTFENCWKTSLNSTEGQNWEQIDPLPTPVAFAGNFALMGVLVTGELAIKHPLAYK